VLFAALGIGGAGLAASLAAYRIYFIIASLISLGISYYYIYSVIQKPGLTKMKLLLWFSTAFTLVIIGYFWLFQ
jgi:hypothetical protein